MSQQTINVGTLPNDLTGDPLRTAFTKVNQNFTELYPHGYLVASLPVSNVLVGTRLYVTDALAPSYFGTLTGGGTVVCPAFYNGTTWVSA